MNTKELQKLWQSQNDFFKSHEKGMNGTEGFVAKVFLSAIFNLKEGYGEPTVESAKTRSNEFTNQTSKKGEDGKCRFADYVIFINSNIVIPVEVEKFENIKAGEKQIIAYQKDWSKKYGILTDGFTWRFYNNNEYKTYSIDFLLQNTNEFQAFWRDYTMEKKYYLEFLNPNQKETLLQEKQTIKVQENRDIFFEETTALIEHFIKKLNLAEHYKDKKEQTEIAYSYLIQFILVKVLVDSGFESFIKDYNEKLLNIVINLEKDNFSKILATVRNLSSAIEKDLYKPFKEDQKYINHKLDDLLKKDNEEIGDISIWLDIVCYIHKFNFGGITNDIFGDIYEGYLKVLYSGTNLGQFFTPPEVVDYMLDEIGWTKENMEELAKQDKLSIVDPSCGSGTFLYSATNILMEGLQHEAEEQSKAVEKLVNDNIFGLDVEEFSLYLAEMSMLMRLLPCIINEKYNNPIDKKLKIFKTKDSIAEFWWSYTINRATQKQTTPDLFGDDYTEIGYNSGIRDEGDLKDTKYSILENHGEKIRSRFDFVIGNPPYIGYNECSSTRKFLAFEMLKGNVKDKNGNIIKVDLNDVYGVNLHSVPHNRKKYAPKPNLYAFFIALANGLLKKGGKMAYIIPQTLFTSSDLDVIRYHLAKNMTIEKIVTFSCKMFVNRGIGHIKKRDIATSSLILIVKKEEPTATHKVEIVHYENADAGVIEALKDIKKSKNVLKKSILQTELLENVDNWNYIKQGKEFLKFYKLYKKNTEDLSCYYEHSKARERFGEEFWLDGGAIIDEGKITDRGSMSDWNVIPYNQNIFTNYQAKTKNTLYYAQKCSIAFPQGSQGINIILPENRIVIWRLRRSDNFQISFGKKIFINNQVLTFSSNNKQEIIYIYSLFNNNINATILHNTMSVGNEKNVYISITSIKSFIRIPLITEKNQHIKAKVIEEAEKMLALETKTLKDFVSFKSKLAVLPQKFEKVEVKNGFLVCDGIEFEILEQEHFVRDLISKQNKELLNEPISLQSLKELEAIDFDLRDTMKHYIDHLVFALYCDVNLQKIEFEDFDKIKQECGKNEFYKLIFPQKEDNQEEECNEVENAEECQESE